MKREKREVDGKRSFHTWRQLEDTGDPQCVHDGRLVLTELQGWVIVRSVATALLKV